MVSALATIGATQNRISFAAQNATTTIQNYTAAESTIRDVDMASEMTTFSQNQVLAQAGAAHRGWENPNHGESGWFGDSEGHSEAARRG